MVSHYLKAVRPINLAIVGIYQYLLYYKYLYNVIESPRLNVISFAGFVLTTVLITGGGYLINDYFDYDGDRINKSNWHQLKKVDLMKYYIVISTIGLLLAIEVAYSIDHLEYVFLYLIAVALLYVYSAWAKRKALIGNIIVALFCGLSIVVLLLTEIPGLVQLRMHEPWVLYKSIAIIGGMSIFAFLVNLTRELVKDVEDIEGDRIEGYTTLPITIGISKSKALIIFYQVVTLALSIVWLLSFWSFFSMLSHIVFAGMVAAQLYVLYYATTMEVKPNYSRLSTLLKVIMVMVMGYTVIA